MIKFIYFWLKLRKLECIQFELQINISSQYSFEYNNDKGIDIFIILLL